MHEISVCQALLEQVEKIAIENNARQVTDITVQIGLLSGIVPELLEHAFNSLKEDTFIETATLHLTIQPVKIRCQSCHAEMEVPPNDLICQQCGDWHTTVIAGDELLLLNVELLTET